jgi:hypothetical protein
MTSTQTPPAQPQPPVSKKPSAEADKTKDEPKPTAPILTESQAAVIKKVAERSQVPKPAMDEEDKKMTDDALDQVLADEKEGVVVQFVAHKGKKNPRFGKNADGTPAPKVPKVEVERKSPWGRFLHKFKIDNPDLCPAEATIEARKVYPSPNGKPKSYEKLYSEVWKQKNPRWPKMTKEERSIAMRAAFIKVI